MQILAVVSVCACLLALLLALRVLVRPNDNPPAAWSLALFLICVSAFVADQAAYSQDWFARFPHAFAVANPLIVALFPSLFLYTDRVTHPTARWSALSLLHFAMPGLALLAELPTYFLSAEEKTTAARVQLSQGMATPGEMVYLLIFDLYGLIYLLLSWRCVHQGRSRLSENAEEGRGQSFRGLEAFVVLLIVLTAVSAVLDFTPWQFRGSQALALAAVVGVFAAFWLMTDHAPLLQVQRRNPGNEAPLIVDLAPAPAPQRPVDLPAPEAPVVVSDVAGLEEDGADAVPPALRPVPASDNAGVQEDEADTASSTLRPVEVERLRRRLKKLFAEDKVHLDAELSLQKLSERADTTRHKMSAAIREIYGLTFYQLVARLRVQEAAHLLRSKAGATRTIADIAFASGFNTLSAFNAAFKAEFGMTPSKFRSKAAEKMRVA